jgi:hypothetical protein
MGVVDRPVSAYKQLLATSSRTMDVVVEQQLTRTCPASLRQLHEKSATILRTTEALHALFYIMLLLTAACIVSYDVSTAPSIGLSGALPEQSPITGFILVYASDDCRGDTLTGNISCTDLSPARCIAQNRMLTLFDCSGMQSTRHLGRLCIWSIWQYKLLRRQHDVNLLPIQLIVSV